MAVIPAHQAPKLGPLEAGVDAVGQAWKSAEETEIVFIYDPDQYQVIQCQMNFADIKTVFPASCRWMPDYGLLRRMGAGIGAGVCAALLMFGVLVGMKYNTQAGVWMALSAVLAMGPLAMLGWMLAPSFPWHSYRPFSILRRVTVPKDEEPPRRALGVSHPKEDGCTVYLVPYAHTNLNLPSLRESDDQLVHQPFVVRAETLFNDAKMEDIQEWITPAAGIRDFIKAYGLLGLIAGEIIALFFMYAMSLD